MGKRKKGVRVAYVEFNDHAARREYRGYHKMISTPQAAKFVFKGPDYDEVLHVPWNVVKTIKETWELLE